MVSNHDGGDESSPGPREIKKSKGWAWADKASLRKIREAFDRTNDVASALSVYFALCECASDAGKERFKTTHAWIAGKSGWSPRTVQARLKVLADLKLIRVHTQALRGPSTYELLEYDQQPLPSDTQPLPSVRQPAFSTSLPTLEENKNKEIQREESAVVTALPRLSIAERISLEKQQERLKEQLAKIDVPRGDLPQAVSGRAEALAKRKPLSAKLKQVEARLDAS
jgi:hypothetical protein